MQTQIRTDDSVPDKRVQGLINQIKEEAHAELMLTIPELGRQDRLASLKELEKSECDESSVWKEIPVSFQQFVNDPYHMGQPRLSYRQGKAIKEFLGEDPKRIFIDPESRYRIAILLWGKGSGKDWICTLLQNYIIYQLLCMKDSRRILTLAPNEPIDILNIAYSAKQAQEVYFTKILNRVYNWPWLSDKYLIVESGKIINQDKHPGQKPSKMERNFVRIGRDTVEFPGLVRAISEHSESESYEGYNVLFWVMDEAAAFKDRGKKANAKKVYSTLRTSAHSRFPILWRGMLISYPRSSDDFMMTMYHIGIKDMAEPEPVMYADKGDTWQINPTKTEKEFDPEKKIDPVDYECKYRCNPPPQEGAVFDPEAIDALLTTKRIPLFDVETSIIPIVITDPGTGAVIKQRRIGKVVDNFRIKTLTARQIPRVFHVDAGLSNCPGACIIAHGEPALVTLPENNMEIDHVINKVVIDQIIVWMPNREKKINVSINNIASVLQEVSEHCNLIRGSYDQWNSESSIEALMMKGIPVEKHNIDAEDYGRMEVLINLGAIEIPWIDGVEWDILVNLGLKKVIQEGGGVYKRYGVGEHGYKDPVDCLAGVCRLLNSPEMRGLISGVAAPRIISGIPLMPTGSGMFLGIESDQRRETLLPGKLIDRASVHQDGNVIQEGMDETRNQAITHHLLAPLTGDRQTLSYKAPANLGRVRPPKVILGK